MLLKVSFSNHRSFRGPSELSMVPANLKEDGSHVLEDGNHRALPSSIIYGANASGKSNVIDAIRYITTVVRNSHIRWEPDRPVVRFPFKLHRNSVEEPSVFSLDFVIDGVYYQFGFETDGKVFVGEWMHAYPNRVRQVWYDRKFQDVKIGKFLKGNVSAVQSVMRPNSLFLSAAAQNNNEQLSQAYRFISSITFAGDLFAPGKEIRIDIKKIGNILEFLKYADVGIVDAKVETSEAPDEVKEIYQSIKSVFDKRVKRKFDVELKELSTVETISFGHVASEGEIVYLDLGEESSGTVRLANLLAPILSVLEGGGVLLIDEIDASLHTLLALKIIEIFGDEKLNPNGAQLIAATHDTNILCSGLLRRDQIWFVEKDEFGSSSLYPLTDFSIRRTDNLEKGYLEGRFGAIPFLGSIRAMRDKIGEGDHV